MDFEAVLFDLDGTLLTYDQDPADNVRDAFARADVAQFCTTEELWAAAEAVGHAESDHDFLTRLFEIAAERHDGPTARAPALATAYEAVVDHTQVSPRPGVEAALDAAQGAGKVGMVTNGEREKQTLKLDTLGITDHFETVVYAGEQTPPKPDPEPFHLACGDLSVTPDRSLYVGNTLEADVQGAKRAGLDVVWYPTERDQADPGGYDHQPDHTVETLATLADLLTGEAVSSD